MKFYTNYARNRVVFWENLHSRDGRDKSQLCGCPYSLIFIKFPSPLNLYPWSKSRTEGLNISTKGLIHLFFTEDGDKMYFYGECFTNIDSNCLYSEYLRRLMLNLLSGAQMLNSRASSGDCVLSDGTDEMFLPNASINNSETLHRLIYF